jgi:hypothetical protein
MGRRVQKNSHLSGIAEGRVRTSPFSAYKDYKVLVTSDFEQVTQPHPGPPYVFGGPWYKRERYDNRTVINASTNLIQGSLMLGNRSSPVTDPLPFTVPTENEEESYGTRLWNSALPTKAVVDLPVALGEIKRDGLPLIPGQGLARDLARTGNPSSAFGSQNLNIEFGWKPIVSDLKKFAKAVIDGDKIIKGYAKGANRDLRHYREIPPLSDVTDAAGSFVILPSAANVFAEGSSRVTRTQRVWFVGHFKYYLPVGDDVLSRMDRYAAYAKKLFGLRLTPDVVWNLAPWSWAADWFGDFGLILENISALGLDGLYGHDCYLMHHTSYDVVYQGTVNSKGISGTLVRRYGEDYKYRRKASPFGFGYRNWNDLSIQQGIIASSLGLSLGSRGFWTSR